MNQMHLSGRRVDDPEQAAWPQNQSRPGGPPAGIIRPCSRWAWWLPLLCFLAVLAVTIWLYAAYVGKARDSYPPAVGDGVHPSLFNPGTASRPGEPRRPEQVGHRGRFWTDARKTGPRQFSVMLWRDAPGLVSPWNR